MPKESVNQRLNKMGQTGASSSREKRALLHAYYDALVALAAKLDAAGVAGGTNAAEVAKFITK